MAIYYGVVHDNRVELEGDARLAEGTRVEVRPHPGGDLAADEEVVKARLRAAGLLAPAPVADAADEDEDDAFEPVVVQGEPLSEQIIRERR
jgi:hypothetical protein